MLVAGLSVIRTFLVLMCYWRRFVCSCLILASAVGEMLPLIPCHHFSAQHVLSLDDEPLVVCGAGSNLFVATSCCSISHYVIAENASDQCKLVGRFPSVGAVDQMAYSEKGE